MARRVQCDAACGALIACASHQTGAVPSAITNGTTRWTSRADGGLLGQLSFQHASDATHTFDGYATFDCVSRLERWGVKGRQVMQMKTKLKELSDGLFGLRRSAGTAHKVGSRQPATKADRPPRVPRPSLPAPALEAHEVKALEMSS